MLVELGMMRVVSDIPMGRKLGARFKVGQNRAPGDRPSLAEHPLSDFRTKSAKTLKDQVDSWYNSQSMFMQI